MSKQYYSLFVCNMGILLKLPFRCDLQGAMLLVSIYIGELHGKMSIP